MFFAFFYLCIKFVKEKDDENIDALVTKFNTFEFSIDEGEIREIQFDRNDVTVIFPPIKGVTVNVLASVFGGRVEVGQITENRFGVHCGKEICFFHYKSEINGTGRVHILSDTSHCHHTFISSKSNENFRVSSSNTVSNISLSDSSQICFLHVPNQEIQYTASLIAKSPAQNLDFNVSLYEDDESEAISLDLKKQKMYKNKVNKPVFVKLESNEESSGTFVYMSQRADPYDQGSDVSNEFVVDYKQSDSMFFLTTNGPEDITIPENIDEFNENLNQIDSKKSDDNKEIEIDEQFDQQENPVPKNGRYFDQGIKDNGLTGKTSNQHNENQVSQQEQNNDDDDESNQIWQDLIREEPANDEDSQSNDEKKGNNQKRYNKFDNQQSIKNEREKMRERRMQREKAENYNIINPDDNERWNPQDDYDDNLRGMRRNPDIDSDSDFIHQQNKPKMRKVFAAISGHSASNNTFIVMLVAILIAIIVIAIAGCSTFIVVQHLKNSTKNEGENIPLLNSHNQNQGYPISNMQFNVQQFPNYQYQGMAIPQQQLNFPNFSQ